MISSKRDWRGHVAYFSVCFGLFSTPVSVHCFGSVLIFYPLGITTCTDMGGFFLAGFSFPLIGFIIYACIDVLKEEHVAYFATFMMCWGTSAPSVLLSTWCKRHP